MSRVYMVVGLILAVVAALLGPDAQDAIAALSGIAVLAAIRLGVREHRPGRRRVWIGWSISVGLFLLAGVVDLVLSGADGVSPYPSLATLIDFLGYGTLIGTAYLMLRLRITASDRTVVADSLIGVGGVAVLVWVYVMVPYLQNDDLAVSGRIASAAFSILSLSFTMVIARLSFGPGVKSTAYRLLSLTAVGALGADIMDAIDLSGRHFPGQEQLSTFFPTVAFVAFGAAALHPTMVDLTTPARETVARMTRARWTVMVVSALIPPFVIFGQIGTDRNSTVLVVLGCWIFLTLLIVLRLGGLVLARERLAEYDRILSQAAAALVASTERSEMVDAATEAMRQIVVQEAPAARVAVLIADPTGWRVERGAGGGVRGAADGELADLSAATITTLTIREPVLLVDEPAADGMGDRPAWALLLPLVSLNQLRGALVASADAPLSPEAQDALRALASDLSLAVESAALVAESHRQRSERRFKSLVENSTDIVAVVDLNVTRFVSPAASRLLGFSEEQFLANPLVGAIATEHQRAYLELVERADGETVLEVQMHTAFGTLRWFEVVAVDMHHEPEISGVVVTAREITERKRAEQQLARSEARFRALVQHSTDVVAVLDGDGMVNYVSPSVQRILGYRPDQLVNREFAMIVTPGSRSNLTGLLHRLASSPGTPHRSELEVTTSSGAVRVMEVALTDLRAEQSVAGIVVNAHDVTERKSLEFDLRHQALHDDLTGLPNRILFRDRAQQALSRRGDNPLALLVIDLDDFRTVNDALGMHVGDEILGVMAFRLQQHLRVGDTAARLGGDEFGVLLESEISREAAVGVGRRILDALREPIEVADRELVVETSIGIVFAEDIQERTAEVLLRSGEMGMFSAKGRGKGRLALFDRSMHEGAFERLELKTDLARALERNELRLHYQPIVDVRSGRIVSFEALMRWQHPERGLVSPGSFIPLAEETGLIVEMGRWLIDEACRQLRVWQERYPGPEPLGMSLNLSARQLEDDRIVADVARAIAACGIPSRSVTLELTESILVDGSGPPRERLEAITVLGVGLVADDFGAGYASYAALQQMPFTGLKLDMSLIEGLTSADPTHRGVVQVRSLIEMAERTGLSVVAEGVECAEQLAILAELGCRRAQGYYFARPDTPERIEALLRRDAGHPVVTAG